MENIYLPEMAVVQEIKEETPQIRTLTIKMAKKQARSVLPGQFMELTIFGSGEFPVSVAAVLNPEATLIQTTIQQVGKATRETARLTPGSKIGIRGPFGNGYPLEAMQGRNICLVTGGVGLAAARQLINYIVANRNRFGEVILLHGARTPGDLIYKDFLFNAEDAHRNNISISVTVDQPDQNWNQTIGPVTELFKKVRVEADNTVAIVCGPGKMMNNVCAGLAQMGLPDDQILLALESRMHCGMGVCGHCAVGYKKVCVDGPIFAYGEVKNNLEKLI